MSDVTQNNDNRSGRSDDDAGDPVGEIRIGGVQAFGLRAAALAGLVVTTTASAAMVISPLATGPCCVSGP
jgi:hypothetical protein